jgi:hypothetical protein
VDHQFCCRRLVCLLCRDDDTDRATMLLVDMHAPAVSVGPPDLKMGHHAHRFVLQKPLADALKLPAPLNRVGVSVASLSFLRGVIALECRGHSPGGRRNRGHDGLLVCFDLPVEPGDDEVGGPGHDETCCQGAPPIG